ncbi:ATPase [Nocardia wallacei]|uniref:ATPase n=1 Tax=Nocardia wallacei TaxID=480035 RepID=UPI00245703A4|nr:ATPase [Nocardia wallacei]
MSGSEVLLIGGRAGVGKSSVGHELHARLSEAGVRHCLIEGDLLDLAYPAPQEHNLAERNLAAMWSNYRALGYRRMIYTNTASVLPAVADQLTAAMGHAPAAIGILLTCTDETARQRLSRREIGTALERHLHRSKHMAERLDREAPAWVHRVGTDHRTVTDIAAEIVTRTGWADIR